MGYLVHPIESDTRDHGRMAAGNDSFMEYGILESVIQLHCGFDILWVDNQIASLQTQKEAHAGYTEKDW